MTITEPGQYDGREPESIATRVIEAVATHDGTDPFDLEPPLGTRIDPDALDALYEGGGGPVVEFGYRGYDVTVEGDGGVSVDRPEER